MQSPYVLFPVDIEDPWFKGLLARASHFVVYAVNLD